MGRKQTAGFTLMEAVVAMAILGLVAATLGSGLVVSFRLNARSEQMLQARLQVAATAELLMAQGIDADKGTNEYYETTWSAKGFGDADNQGFCMVTIISSTYPDTSITATIHVNPEHTALPGGGS